MKHLTLTKVLAALMCVLGATVALDKPSSAQSAQQDETFFSCGDLNGIPTTMFNSPRGKTPLIRWRSRIFELSGWTPSKRCELVSRRFQVFYENGYLQNLATGKVGNEYVVCATREVGELCDRSNVLFTVLPEDRTDPDAVLTELLQASNLGSPLNQSQDVLKLDSKGKLYIDVEEWIYHTPTE